MLIIEPDATLAQTLNLYFQTDYEVIVCQDAQSAIVAADDKTPDLVILELALAKNNGVAFLHEFRSYTEWMEIPVIIYSRIPREDTGIGEADWSKQHVEAYLYKPLTSLAVLSEYIGNNLNKYETI